MTTYEKGDIVLVPFPFSDQSAAKKRPAVVISSANHNHIASDIVIIAVTSRATKNPNMNECFIEDWSGSGLLKPSTIKPAISTIEKLLVLKKLGKLSRRDLVSLNEALKYLLDMKE